MGRHEHRGKYPPSITFFALEVGLAMLVLGGLSAAGKWVERVPGEIPLAVAAFTLSSRNPYR